MQGYADSATLANARRAIMVLMLALGMLATTALAPVRAGESGGDDVESVRATVLETYNYKINKLGNYKAETSNEDRKGVYQGGINELTSIRDSQVVSADDVETLWDLKDLAHSIFNETKAAANEVENNPEEELAAAKNKANNTVEYKIGLLRDWIEGCENAEARRIVDEGIAKLKALFPKIEAATTADAAYAIKDEAHAIYHSTIDRAKNAKGDDTKEPEDKGDEPKEKSDAEKAAEALANARRNTLSLIDRKTAILSSASEAAKIPAVVEIFSEAAAEVAALKDDAKTAKSVGALKEINAAVMAIYEEAKGAASEVRNDTESTPEDALNDYLRHVVDYVSNTTQAAASTADDSPETFASLVQAKAAVLSAVGNVQGATESGNRLDARWEDLHDALRDYRRALVRHYIALGEPALIRGLLIPG